MTVHHTNDRRAWPRRCRERFTGVGEGGVGNGIVVLSGVENAALAPSQGHERPPRAA
ncbi:MAG TPA: hypothetical protein VMU95_04565 [Trebonia sp.]|nr:hypothetical protein [Trebonia sp.]